MARSTITLGRVLGIPIGLDISWFLIFALLTWSMATGVYPAEFPGWPDWVYWLTGAVTAIMLFASVLAHELAHSLVAKAAKMQVTSITLFLFGGVSQIGSEPPSAAVEFRMAAVGPLTSFGLALIFFVLQPLAAGFAPALALLRYLAYINVSLGAFNLIPGFPLDGGRVFRAALWKATGNLSRATSIAGNAGRLVAYVFIMIGLWTIFNGNLGNGLWIVFIGWFLENAASAQIREQALKDVLAGRTVSEAMNRSFAAIPEGTSLQQVVDDFVLKGAGRGLVVMRGDEPLGLLTVHCIKEKPREEWAATPAASCMIPVDELKRVRPEDDLWGAMQQMDRNGVNQLPVMSGGRVVGMLGRDDVISHLSVRKELGLPAQ